MNKLRDAKARARALVGDPDAQWTTDSYLQPLMSIAYDDIIGYLRNFASPAIEKVVPILNVPAGTTSFLEYQAGPSVPLSGLVTPLRLKWKQAGQPENQYRLVNESSDLPDIVPGNYLNGMSVFWEWRAYVMYVTPLGFPADFQMRGEFLPPLPIKDDDYLTLHPMIATPLGYWTASLIGGESTNATVRQTWKEEAMRSIDDLSSDLTRKDQGKPGPRLGRMNSRGRRR